MTAQPVDYIGAGVRKHVPLGAFCSEGIASEQTRRLIVRCTVGIQCDQYRNGALGYLASNHVARSWR